MNFVQQTVSCVGHFAMNEWDHGRLPADSHFKRGGPCIRGQISGALMSTGACRQTGCANIDKASILTNSLTMHKTDKRDQKVSEHGRVSRRTVLTGAAGIVGASVMSLKAPMANA